MSWGEKWAEADTGQRCVERCGSMGGCGLGLGRAWQERDSGLKTPTSVVTVPGSAGFCAYKFGVLITETWKLVNKRNFCAS